MTWRFDRRRLWGALLLLAGLAMLAILLPLPDSLLHPAPVGTLRILDREGRLLYEHRGDAPGANDRLRLKDIPQSLVDAVVSIEDHSFYEHGGVSVRGVARATMQNLRAGGVVEGGSTITQQLVRIRAPGERSIVRKMLEMLRAWKMERALSKEQILEAYLNDAYFGHRAYGVAAAAKTYFGKSVAELSLGEASMLAGLLQSPSRYDPFSSMQRARDRRLDVLDAMKRDGKITDAEEHDAADSEVLLAPDRVDILAPHFVFWILSREDLPRSGTITTTLDLDLQREAERAIQTQLSRLDGKNVTSAAAIVLDAHTGDVLAMVGSSDYFDAKHDGAVNVTIAARQPGSAMKPFTYALAFSKGATAATTVADVETQFFTQEGNPYVPRNYDYGYHGLVRYREALANSYNIAAVKVLEHVGVPSLLAFLKNAGITTLTETPEHYGLALTLGDAEVTLLELTRAYGIFPRGGNTLVERSLQNDPVQPGRQVLDPKVAWLVANILDDDQARIPEFGEDGPLSFPFPVAAKTGTTRNSRDNWTVGFTPDRLVGVWVGNADNSPMKGTSGITGAGPIFHDVMTAAVEKLPPAQFPMPAGFVQREICAISGKLPTSDCPRLMREVFITGTEPTEHDDMFRSVAIDRRNGLLAGASCPKEMIENRVFAVFPPEVKRWSLENGWKEPPTIFSPLCDGAAGAGEGSAPWLTIVRPHGGDEFKLDPLIKNDNEMITLEASADSRVKTVDWYVNGKKAGEGTAPNFTVRWMPQAGEWTLEARNGALSQKIRFRVVR